MTSLRENSFLREVGFFALYLLLIALGLFVGLVIWRQALGVVFYEWLPVAPWVARFLYMGTVVLGALALVAGLLVAEPYLNHGKQRGQLLRRFLRVAVPLVVAGLVGYLIMLAGR
jgi:hypothetical protein